MNQNASSPAADTSITSDDIQSRLAAIARAMSERQQAPASNTPTKRAPLTCPMDPAERAACDSCQ